MSDLTLEEKLSQILKAIQDQNRWLNGLIAAMSIYTSNATSPTSEPTPPQTDLPTSEPTPTSPSSTFGNTAIGTYKDTNDANAQSISYFKCTTTESVTDIIAYISGVTSGKVIAALYAVNGDSPGALLAQSNVVNIGTTFSWVDFQLQTPYTITAGTTYGLAIMGDIPINIALVTGTGQRTGGPGYSSYAKGFTNPFGTIWFNDLTGAMSIYATSTSSSTPDLPLIPTLSPTPTPTPTPTPPSAASGSYSGTNLIPLPHDATTYYPWGIYDVNPSSFDCNNNLDFSVIGHNGVYPAVNVGSIANDEVHHGYVARKYNGARECDASWINVSPGQHIILGCWFKSGASGGQDPDLKAMFHRSIALGFDYYGIGYDGQITWVGGNFANGYDYIQYGIGWNTDWTYVQYDFIVPTTIPIASAQHGCNLGDPVVPIAIYPWVTGDFVDSGQIWFSDAVLYINPSG